MPTKISERNLVIGIICLALGIIIFLNKVLTVTPVRISGKGIFYAILAFILVAVGIRSCKRSVLKA